MNFLEHLSREFNFLGHHPMSNKISQANKRYYQNVSLVREPHPFRHLQAQKDQSWISIKNQDGKEIGYCQYQSNTGQIGILRMDEKYRYQGTGKKVLDMCIEDMKAAGATEIWGVTSSKEFSQMSAFEGKVHYRNPAHSTVTCDGYYMKL
jgi:ribosomal protein S18 acetylase RimI-like enzyme